MIKKFLFFTIISVFLSLPLFSEAQNVLGQEVSFNIESSHDLSERTELSATLIKNSLTAYWYIDTIFWEELNSEQQAEIEQSLISLIEEFETNIYPALTRTFGFEWTPGIDKDTRITILIHPMRKGTGGYTDTSDEYPQAQIPESNEREMIYLNTQYINSSLVKSFLAHEFIHLITFNQKNKTYDVSEDVWLNEARAEYAVTFLGYDREYDGSNLERRVKDFLNKPADSLTEWREVSSDYGVTNLFIQYLVDHYGIKTLADSLKMRETGIQSINAVLSKHGFQEDFSQIFTDWTIAILINDCQVSEKYCYFNPNLENFRITPLINYLPFIGQSTLSVSNTTKDWAGNWHKFIGGTGTLKLEFNGNRNVNFKVPYIIQDSVGNFVVDNLALDENQRGQIFITEFGSENISLTIIPIAYDKISDFSSLEPSRTFFWSASTEEKEEINIPSLPSLKKPISQMSRNELLSRITEIENLIIQLQAILSELGVETSCERIEQNLSFGLRDNNQVRCLQEFLKAQGHDIYPEGIVSGNFFVLTQRAVIRFQEKYASEVLTPLGLISGTGFVGSSTRAKINELLTK